METEFPGGAAEAVAVAEPEIVFDAPAKGCPRPMWFCFKVHGRTGHDVRFTLRNAGACLGASSIGVTQPVYRADGDDWCRVARSSCRYDAEQGRFEFHFRLPAETVTVASCYPYQLADLEQWLARVDQPGVRQWVLDASPGGRPIYALQLTDAHVPGRKKLVWVTARQHAGEVQGSYVLEGMVDALLSGGTGRLLRETVFCFAPMVDVDAVEAGSYGKDQPPVDFNRDWTSAPHHPAVRAIQNAIDAGADQNDYVLFLDLHGPTPGDPSYLVPAHGAVYDELAWREHWRLGALFEAETPKRCPLRCADYRPGSLNWSYENAECVATESNRLRWGVTAATLEIAYHRTATGHLVRPDDWRAFGRALVRGVGRWLHGEPAGEPPPRPVPSLRNWLVPHLLQNVALSESGETLRLTPNAAPNRAWVQTRDAFAGPIRLRVRHNAEQPVTLGLRSYRYDAAGRRLPGWTTQQWSAGTADERLLAPELPPGIVHRLAVVAEDLPGPIELEIRPA